MITDISFIPKAAILNEKPITLAVIQRHDNGHLSSAASLDISIDKAKELHKQLETLLDIFDPEYRTKNTASNETPTKGTP